MKQNAKFQNKIANKYQIYNSLFLTLPFEEIENIGVLLPMLSINCRQGFANKKNPKEIIEDFFSKQTHFRDDEQQINLLFKFIQYIERQVVLFDAVEDAAFEKIHHFDGNGTIPYLFNRANSVQKIDDLVQKLQDFKAKIVLTAHPTQFYPGRVLSIISELEAAIRIDDIEKINLLLQQLGRTAFISHDKPTPAEEATRLMWYLENVFYHSVAKVHMRLRQELNKVGVEKFQKDIINIGFWPCGDRDGNPYVTADITIQTAKALHHKIFICYFKDAKNLRKRMTFSGVDELAENIYAKLSHTIFNTKGKRYQNKQEIIDDLLQIKQIVNTQHNGLFVEVVEDFIVKVELFGFHFTTMDIRQDSRIHTKVLNDIFEQFWQGKLGNSFIGNVPKDFALLSESQKIDVLLNIEGQLDSDFFEDKISRETLKSLYVIKQIQQQNGQEGCHRYIISNTQSTLNIIEVYALARLCGWKKDDFSLDIVPLLETIDDLANGQTIMNQLYNCPAYKHHLSARNNKQYIMLGFSDGTKDGGYLKANWEIFKAKEQLTKVSRQHEMKVVFFDGRGGPPARGGGNTNKFYSSLGDKIENHEIELTIQGQTISSNFGTLLSSQYNLEQFYCAGIENTVYKGSVANLDNKQRNILENLAEVAYQAYRDFKNNPVFIDYLEDVSVLKYYGLTNIGSRPSKRGDGKLTLSSLRAIPFVGAWTQMKQNVPGFYGVGTALKQYEDSGNLDEIKTLYKKSLFFRTLIDNSMQALCKSYFPLTSYLQKDSKFGQFWLQIFNEYTETKRLLLIISGHRKLLEQSPNIRASIAIRENIILPLITIQQYALMKVKEIEKSDTPDDKLKGVYEKMIIRAFFGSINASRNAA